MQNSYLPGCQRKASQLDQTHSFSASCISAPAQVPQTHPHLYPRGLVSHMSCKQESKLQGMRAGTWAHSYSWPQRFLQETAYFFSWLHFLTRNQLDGSHVGNFVHCFYDDGDSSLMPSIRGCTKSHWDTWQRDHLEWSSSKPGSQVPLPLESAMNH